VGEVQPTPRAAAVLLILWWKGTYGSRWAEFWAYRKTQGWKVVSVWETRGKGFLAGQSRVRVGCDVRVWDKDGPGGWLVVKRGRLILSGDRPNRPPFADPPAARAAFARWVRDAYGLFAPVAALDLRRRTTPTHNPGRLTPVPRTG
jgi:Ni,Fe-hydrogenase III component G